MEEKTVDVPKITCGHCVKTIERELSELPGVITVAADQQKKTVFVRYGSPVDWAQVRALLDEIGYPPTE